MDAAKSVTATFTAQFTLTLTMVGSGTITAQPLPVAGTYAAGTLVTLTTTPATNFQFTGWSGACSGSGACSVTMDAAKSVTATFTDPPPPPPAAPSTCDGKIGDLLEKVAADKRHVRHDHRIREALRRYSAALVELGTANLKVGDGDKRYVRALREFTDGKAALCAGHYWRADRDFREAYEIAHQILKHHRR